MTIWEKKKSTRYKWLMLINNSKCYYNNWKEYVEINGFRYWYSYPNEPSYKLKFALIKLTLSSYIYRLKNMLLQI
jgi:hypothetical protein